MSQLQLLGFPVSTYVRVCRIVLEEKGVDYELVPVPPHSPGITAINPLGKVPALRHGALELYESRAIVGYIDRVFPGRKLIPEDPVAAARVEQWVSLTNTLFDVTLIRKYLMAYMFPKSPDKQPDRTAIESFLPDVQRQLDMIAGAVAENGHLVGDDFTYADANLVPIFAYIRTLPETGEMIAKSGALTAFIAKHDARPSVIATVPPKG